MLLSFSEHSHGERSTHSDASPMKLIETVPSRIKISEQNNCALHLDSSKKLMPEVAQ